MVGHPQHSQKTTPVALADSGASHVVLLNSTLQPSEPMLTVNLGLAAGEVKAVEHHREVCV